MNTDCSDEIPFWVPFDGLALPKNAIKGGQEDDQTLFIGRAPHERSLTPGKIYEQTKTLVLPWGTIANTKTDFEVLVGPDTFNWVPSHKGNVPENAFPAGKSENGETLFIGRYKHLGNIIVGKIQPSHHVFYYAFQDKELNSEICEVLVV